MTMIEKKDNTRPRKKHLSNEEWEQRFSKHVDDQYYTCERVSSGSSSTGLARIIRNPYVVKGE